MATACIKCKFKKAGATPSLCLSCLKLVAWPWFVFNNRDRMPWACYEMQDNQYFKNYLNRIQRQIRASHKRHDEVP